jgi:hypothetical protein
MQRGSIAAILVVCSLLTACGGIPQKVFIDEPSSEPDIIREEMPEKTEENEKQHNDVEKPGLTNISIDPGFSYEPSSEIVEDTDQSTGIASTEVVIESESLPEVKDGPCLRGEEHKTEVVCIQAPTCELDGINETKCSVCNVVLGYENVAATGHDWSDYNITNVTCTVDGSKSRYCKNCQKTETEVLKATGSHVFGEYTVTKPATCDTVGEQTRICEHCNKKETKEVPKLSHEFGDWSTSTVPTCTVKGVQVRTCKKCGYLERKELESLSHSTGDWQVVSEPTCIETGLRKRYCTLCGTELDSETIPPKDHEYEIFKEEDGTLIRICKICKNKED